MSNAGSFNKIIFKIKLQVTFGTVNGWENGKHRPIPVLAKRLLEIAETSNVPSSPAAQLEQSQVMAAIEDAVKALPDRQREAFMLRYWEELDVSETAKVMGCSEGSVKTHCSRATHALAKVLKSKGITL